MTDPSVVSDLYDICETVEYRDLCESCGAVLTEGGSLAYEGIVVCADCFEESLEEGEE